MTWKGCKPSNDRTHHIDSNGIPLYGDRFEWVLPFHEPGLAPAGKDGGAFHIKPDGSPAYGRRFSRTFGFYEDRATVVEGENWFHISQNGKRSYENSWSWCGNFQNGRCTVRDKDGGYFHIRLDGMIVQGGPWKYAGDFREGAAVVRDNEGMCGHIDPEGNFIHNGSFFDLDVYHKGYARARDANGWFHVNRNGKDVSGKRFMMLEPFYNGQALTRDLDGTIKVIDEGMNVTVEIPQSKEEEIEWYHSISISYWASLSIKLGIEFGLADGIEERKIEESGFRALKNAWAELGLWNMENDKVTLRGNQLRLGTPERDLADYWLGPQLTPWVEGKERLANGKIPDFFDVISNDSDTSELVQRVLDRYAQVDWPGITNILKLGNGGTIVDIAGGKGALLLELLKGSGDWKGILFERPEVIQQMEPSDEIELVAGDMFVDTLPDGNVYVLSRVLHDWNDDNAEMLLRRVAQAGESDTRLIVIDRVVKGKEFGMLDLNMYLTNGGKERTMNEWIGLFGTTGWAILQMDDFNDHVIFKLALVK